MVYFTPQNALRQRAALRRYSPGLERVAGGRIERFIRDPSGVLGSPSTWFAGGLSDFFHSAAASVDLLLVPFFAYYIGQHQESIGPPALGAGCAFVSDR
jgi:hypothetical protein